MTTISLRVAINEDIKANFKYEYNEANSLIFIDEKLVRDKIPNIRDSDIIKSVSISINNDNEVITLVVCDLNHFGLNPFSNSNAEISYLKIYDIKKTFTVFRTKVKNLDIENSNGTIQESEISRIRINIEEIGRKANQPNLQYERCNLTFRNSELKSISIYGKLDKLELDNTIARQIKSSSGHSITDAKFLIHNDSSIDTLNVNGTLDYLKCFNSVLRNLQISDSKINEFNISNSSVNSILGFKTENLANKELTDFTPILNALRNNSDSTEYFNALEFSYNFRISKLKKQVFSNFFLRFVLGYGFRPFRIFFSNIIIMLLFWIIYLFLILTELDHFQINCITGIYEIVSQTGFLSITIDMSLGFNSVVPETTVGRIIVSIQTILGVIFNNLLVTSIYRRYF
ncbi:hypothetical protein [Leptospira bouyouniensis]|uniref:Potassium channel domain-containing protein n=1 Tax=Leptospira bouyouniensis TaxID=2484911 RepID=A0ABY2LAY6_9LEPT|nr:hypothetical protein [Leptospira bouyouniensis]TGK54254.1 hypothetical protein EHQ10_00370 [Leptospira bouyouniensis]